jgi:putative lysine transport system permease protein
MKLRFWRAFAITASLLIFWCLSTKGLSNKILKIGMECAYAPFNWTQSDDSDGAVKIESGEFAGGYDVEIAKRIAKELNRELVIVKLDWTGFLPALTSGKVDLIIGGMSPNEERRKSFDFSDYYYTSKIVMVVKKNSRFAAAQNIQDFAGAKITAQLETLHYNFIEQIKNVDKHPAMEDFATMIVALNSGKIDAYVSEKPSALSVLQSNPDFTYVEFSGENGFTFSNLDEVSVSAATTKNNPILYDVNNALTKIPEIERQTLMDAAVKNQLKATGQNDFFGWVRKIIETYGIWFLQGTATTIFIAIIGTIVGLLIGIFIGIFRSIPQQNTNSTNFSAFQNYIIKIINCFFALYVEVFRGTPMIIQAMIIYYGLMENFNINFTPISAGLLIVSINTGAYMAEVVRGGIQSIDRGQTEAAYAVGMTHWQTMINVVLPQAIRNILPATGNEFIINIKDTSVLNIISVTELFFVTKSVKGVIYRTYEPFLISAAIYLFLSFAISRILKALENKMDGAHDFTLTTSSTMPESIIKVEK